MSRSKIAKLRAVHRSSSDPTFVGGVYLAGGVTCAVVRDAAMKLVLAA